jgi:hypothetical protein
MQRAMEIYKQARKRSRDAATLDTPMNPQIAATKQSDKSSPFGDSKEELRCAPDNGHLTDVDMGLVPKSTSTPHDSLISEIGLPCFRMLQYIMMLREVKKFLKLLLKALIMQIKPNQSMMTMQQGFQSNH